VCGSIAVCGRVRQCGSAAGCGSAAVCSSARGRARGSVWRQSAHGNVRAVRGGVGSALGSVWQCTRQCAAVLQCAAVRAAVCSSANGRARGSVWRWRVTVRRAVRGMRMVVCAQCARQCAAVPSVV
jgi:hypothetical protein